MRVTIAHIQLKPDFGANFIAASKENHSALRIKKGTVRFGMLKLNINPTRCMCFEACLSDIVSAAHKQTSHDHVSCEQAVPWITESRLGIANNGLRRA